MSQSLLITLDNKHIGIVRNPYERAVSLYFDSLNYIGFEKWLDTEAPIPQKLLYKNCDIIVRFEDWRNEFDSLNLQPKDTSILESVRIFDDWERWLTIRIKTKLFHLYRHDIDTYGYRI